MLIPIVEKQICSGCQTELNCRDLENLLVEPEYDAGFLKPMFECPACRKKQEWQINYAT